MSGEIAWLSQNDADDPGRLREAEDREPVACCDNCGAPLLWGAKTLQGVGSACSSKCLNAICLKHEARMLSR